MDTLPSRSVSRPTAASWTAAISSHSKAGRCREALSCYEQMQQEGMEPDKYTIITLLKVCSRLEDLGEAKRIHRDAVQHGFGSDVFVGSGLVSMYAKCGNLVEAQRVFDSLAERDVVLWNAMVAGYAKQAQGQRALQLFWRMQEEGIQPDARTFVSALQACGNLAEEEGVRVCEDGQNVKAESLRKGRRIHMEAGKRGFENDAFVGNTLVSMYAKCGSIVDAEKVFGRLSERSVVSWTAMLAAYTQQHQGEEAFRMFLQMQEEGVWPDARAFVSLLRACGSVVEKEEGSIVGGHVVKMESLRKVREIHAAAALSGLESHVFVSSSLVSLYAKCGSIMDAQQVFDRLSTHDLVTWNAMLAAYAQQEHGQKALRLFWEMQDQGIRPNARSFVSAIQACSSLAKEEESALVDGQYLKVKSLRVAKELQAGAAARGFESDTFVGNTFVSMYAKCGSIRDAKQVFDRLSKRNLATWNAIIGAYAQLEQGEHALQLYHRMQEEGVNGDARTLVSALQACGSLAGKEEGALLDGEDVKIEMLQKGKQVHSAASGLGLETDVFVGSSLVSLYAKCGSLVDAQQVFDGLPLRNIVSWNAMISAAVQQDQGERALQVYHQLQDEGVRPDAWTFVSALKACGSLAEKEESVFVGFQSVKAVSLQTGKEIHAAAASSGFESDVFVGNTLVSMYAKCGSIKDAQQVFDRLSDRNVVSWTAMIAAYAQQRQGDRALQVYARMQAEGVKADDATFVSILEACSISGALDTCLHIHEWIMGSGLQHRPSVARGLIHAYSSCGSMVDAQRVFDSLPSHDVASWSALISGYAQVGDFERGRQCYEDMCNAGVNPDQRTFLALLSACSHAGKVAEGLEYFDTMITDHGIPAELEHYTSVIDLVGRAGLFDKAEYYLSEMCMEPDLPLWLCLLAACRLHGNVALGRRAFDAAIKLDPELAAPYSIMANIYADAGRLDHARHISDLRNLSEASKDPGRSWIQHGQKVHYFLVRDHRHQQEAQLYGILEKLHSELKNVASGPQQYLSGENW